MSPLQPLIHVVQNVTTMLESNRRTGRGQTNENNILNDVISLLLLSQCLSNESFRLRLVRLRRDVSNTTYSALAQRLITRKWNDLQHVSETT